jgi:hypothetical protein
LTKFQRKGVEHYLRNYIETVISSAYFKVPDFRDRFIDCLKRKKD